MHSKKSSDRILYLLKSRGPQTVKQVAESLEITTMGARQHLKALENQKLIESESVKARRGRPLEYWRLTEQGQSRFPDSHGQLTKGLLQGIAAEFGEAGLQKLIDRRTSEVCAAYAEQMANCSTLEAKLEKLCEIRTAEGYMAEFRHSANGYVLVENHCPICEAARECQKLCRSELETFQQLLGPEVKVIRQDHILEGARRCAYRIIPA